MKIPLSYTWRSLWTRRTTTLLTLGGVTLVVFVFAAVLMLARGVESTLVETGSPDNVILVRRAATSELVSQIDREAVAIIRTHPEIAQTADGTALLSAETYIIINLAKKETNDMGNVVVRGVSSHAMELRAQVRLAEGRMFEFGKQEVIVGSNIREQFQGAELGQTLRFGDATWTIVGMFEGGGTAFDSELWGDVEQMQAAFGRPVFSSVTFRLAEPESYESIKQRISEDPRTQAIDAKREQLYYQEQSQFMADFIRAMGIVVTVIFSIGAMIGAMITMYAAVANRTVEIGTMRALGFRRRSILYAFLVESILLSLLGGIAGVALASATTFIRISTVNFGTFSELAFGFVLSPDIITAAIVFAVTMGVLGGFLPAVRAARLNIITALRSS